MSYRALAANQQASSSSRQERSRTTVPVVAPPTNVSFSCEVGPAGWLNTPSHNHRVRQTHDRRHIAWGRNHRGTAEFQIQMWKESQEESSKAGIRIAIEGSGPTEETGANYRHVQADWLAGEACATSV